MSNETVTVLVSNGWLEIYFKLYKRDNLKSLINNYACKLAEQRDNLVFLSGGVIVTENTLASSLKCDNITVQRRG